MSLIVQSERWREIEEEIRPIYIQHWQEMGLDGNELSLDIEKYRNMDDAGTLLSVTARKDGRLVGYFLNFIMRHPHYDLLTAAMDVYYLLPEYRVGSNGIRLFEGTEKECRNRGVGFMLATARIDRSAAAGRIFQLMGWKNSRLVYEKKVI